MIKLSNALMVTQICAKAVFGDPNTFFFKCEINKVWFPARREKVRLSRIIYGFY